MKPFRDLEVLQERVVACHRCPRLARYVRTIKRQYPTWWCRPVPSFGDARARILVVGLAPGRAGSNRTGRMFTGDGSGAFLYPILHQLGLASRPMAVCLDDGLILSNLYITAVVRCAPPQNKPTVEEIHRCSQYVREEMASLPNLRVVVTLGKIAHDATMKLLDAKPARYPFRHEASYVIPAAARDHQLHVVASYHPSRQNTQTGRLTATMFRRVFERAMALATAGDS